jgi:DNA primase
MNESVIEQIKRKLDIVEEIGAVVALKRSGKAFKGLCPFHNERTPSFYVFPETATWRCFGCNEGGDIFSFVEKQQSLEFKDALEVLAEKAGVTLNLRRGDEGAGEADEDVSQERRRLYALNEAAAIWFHHQLLTAGAASYARTYLESRGVSNETIGAFRLGFAPDQWDALTHYLLGQGYSEHELVVAGFAREREAAKGGGLYDYFRNRIIFPIRDARGRTIGFGGRELGGGHPKYLNTPQTPLFDKSSVLYAFDMAREAIRREDRVIIVEGYMDALIAHQYGSRNTVACIGSAITEKHVRQVKKLTRRVTLALDPDSAGEAATLRGISVAQEAFDRVAVPVVVVTERQGRGARPGGARAMIQFEEQAGAEITIARLPEGEDPDEFIRRDVDAWRTAIQQALPLVEYSFVAQTTGLDLATPQGKAEAAKRLLPVILAVHDRVKQDAYMRRLAALLRVEERALRLELERLKRQEPRGQPHAPGNARSEQGTPASTPESAGEKGGLLGDGGRRAIEKYCLGILLTYPAIWREIYAIIKEDDFAETEARELYRAFVYRCQGDAPPEMSSFLAELPPILRELALHTRAQVEAGPPLEGTGLSKAARHAAYRLKLVHLKEAITMLQYLQKDAEGAGDHEAVRALQQQMVPLLLQRHAIESAVPLQA